MDTWPATLPDPLFEGYEDTIGDGRIRSRTDVGPPKVRRRTTSAVRPLRCSMIMTDAQLTTLKTFIRTTLLGGALPFYWTDVHNSAQVIVQIGESMPVYRPINNSKWQVSFDLEILP